MAQYPVTIDLAALDASAGMVISGAAAGDGLGRSVAHAGDVNGDGFIDLMLGAPGAANGGAGSGSAYVVFGGAGGFGAGIDLTALDGSNGLRLDGENAYDGAAYDLGSAGDINGDGYDDLLVSAPRADHNAYSAGSAYVVFGKADGWSSTLDLGSLDGSNGFRLDGHSAYDQAGIGVAGAGDVNGDGLDDLIVGARGPSGFTGEAYVIYGKAGGFAAATDLTTLDGTDGFILRTATPAVQLGYDVSGCGDVNDDGFDDILIGAPAGGNGRAMVLFGTDAGIPAVVDLDSLDGSNGFTLTSAIYGATGEVVSSAGDINGDGVADLLVAAPFTDINGTISGSTYVVFGQRTGFSATVDLDALDGGDGFRLDGPSFSESGNPVRAAGDVNGDGFGDLIIGAQGLHAENGAYIVFGKASGFAAATNLTSLDGTDGFFIQGAADYDKAGISVDGLGDINGDGLDDLMVGASMADPSGRNNAGAAYIIYGRLPDAAVSRVGTLVSQTLVGGDFNDRLAGVGGDDVLWGHDGTNTLLGGDGADTLIGGAGSDRMNGGDEADSMTGGRGNDIYFIDNPGDVVVEVGAEGRDTVQTAIDLTLQAGQSIEVLKVWDTASGLHLVGNEFDTHIVGGAGDDTLQGGGGRDILNGGAGADHFVFTAAGDSTNLLRDHIVDLAQGQDVIDLSAIDADSTQGGDQAFHLAAGNHFHADAGEMIIRHVGPNTLVMADIDGDRSADFTLVVHGNLTLTTADFVL